VKTAVVGDGGSGDGVMGINVDVETDVGETAVGTGASFDNGVP